MKILRFFLNIFLDIRFCLTLVFSTMPDSQESKVGVDFWNRESADSQLRLSKNIFDSRLRLFKEFLTSNSPLRLFDSIFFHFSPGGKNLEFFGACTGRYNSSVCSKNLVCEIKMYNAKNIFVISAHRRREIFLTIAFLNKIFQ